MPTKLLLVVVFFSAFYCRQTGENDDQVSDDYKDNKDFGGTGDDNNDYSDNDIMKDDNIDVDGDDAGNDYADYVEDDDDIDH